MSLQARTVYARMLRAAPRTLRERHGPEMVELFVAELAGASGLRGQALVWIKAVADIAAAWVPARRRAPHRQRKEPFMVGTEFRYAWRSLRRQRGASIVAALMLSLGIGANIVVFSFVNGLLLKPFPFASPDRLVYINETAPRWNLDVVGVNYPDFWAWHEHASTFEAMAVYDQASFNLSDGRGAERILGGMFSRDFPKVLGVQPLLGRTFSEDEDRPEVESAPGTAASSPAPGVVILSERLWRERFDGDPGVLGRTLRLDGKSHVIVGVLPKVAEFPEEAALWVPFRGDPNAKSQSYGGGAMARLKAGVSLEAANDDLRRAQEPIWATRDTDRIVSPFAHSLHDELTRDARESVPALAASVVLLLVVACANVASVMLARAIARRREMGIRLAIGSGRARLVRQLFIENLLLSLAGTAVGVVIGRTGLAALVAWLHLELPHWMSLSADWRLIAFAALVAAATTVLFGWAPAFHAVRGSVRGAMSDAVSGNTSAPSGRRTLSWLVAAEFGLAVILMMGAGLLIRAYGRVVRVDPGFTPDHVLTFRLALSGDRYATADARLAFWNDLLARLRGTAGVASAGLVSCPPLGCHWGYFLNVDDRAPRPAGAPDPVTLVRVAGDGYFDAMGLKLLQGRQFTPADNAPNAARVAIVNETFVRTFWPPQTNAIGKRIYLEKNAPITVVGVQQDERHYGLERPMRPGVFLPLSWPRTQSLAVAVKTLGDPGSFAADVRRIVAAADPDLPLFQVQTMNAAVGKSMLARSLYSWLIVVFASVALVLALGGTYGVTSYLVSQRQREIGIRLAVGAKPGDIARAVMRSNAPAILAGVAAGVAGAIGLATQLGSMLFGVPPADPIVIAAAVAVSMSAAIAANLVPAARAARIDPSKSLRVS